jgi:phage terminase small subunit
MKELTPKQEDFAQQIVKGSTQADAYRTAYNASSMKDETIWSNASRLIDNSKVKARIKELRQPAVDKVNLTLESHLTDLLKLRNMAAKDEKWSAAIQAETVRGKAAGLHIDKIDMKQDLDVVVEIVRFGDE